ncbi:MAG: hypothetical protein V4577_19490 [Bacteroidota bacterium]
MSCVLDGNGSNTGFVNVGTLEQFFNDDNSPTGTTKSNLPSDANYIANYRDINMCPLPSGGGDTPPSNSVIYAFNGCTGILVMQLVNTVTADSIDIDVPHGGDVTQNIPSGTYDITMHVSQDGGMRPQMICNGVRQVTAPDATRGFNGVTTPINVSVRPTTDAITP